MFSSKTERSHILPVNVLLGIWGMWVLKFNYVIKGFE